MVPLFFGLGGLGGLDECVFAARCLTPSSFHSANMQQKTAVVKGFAIIPLNLVTVLSAFFREFGGHMIVLQTAG